MWTTLALPRPSPEHLWTPSSGDQNQTLFTVMCAHPVVWRVSAWIRKIIQHTTVVFSGFSVGFCINEEKVIWFQLELGK